MTTLYRSKGAAGIRAFALGLGLALTSAVSPVLAQDVNAIVNSIDARPTGKTSTANMTLTLFDKRGNKRVRELKALSKDQGNHDAMSLTFEAPLEVAGSAFLSLNYTGGKASDAWLFLPSLNKTRRVAQSNQSDSFMGSDFSYSDIIGTDTNDWTYTLEGSEAVDGKDCFVLTAKPKSNSVVSETGYTSRRIWVRKDSYYVVRGQFTTKSGQVKLMSAKGLRTVSGIWTPKSITMATTKGGKIQTHSTISFGNVKYNVALSDAKFKPDALSRGTN